MIIDARALDDGTVIDTDLCIIGAGPAGITIARELAHAQLRICIVESGGLKDDAQTQALGNLAEVGGDLVPPVAGRRRRLGGAATAWNVLTTSAGGGVRYLPLDDIDFEARDWLPHSGWPLSRAELDPYYERAQAVCGIGPYTYRVEDWQRPDAQPWPFDPTALTTTIEQYGHKRIFARAADLHFQPNVTLLLNATLTQLDLRAASSAVETSHIACANGRRHRVNARVFVLASGGIENARLLLLSNGIGNQNDLVGRFFMDHHSVYLGELIPASPDLVKRSALYDLRRVDGTWIMAKLKLTDATLREERLLNGAVRIGAVRYAGFRRARSSLRHALRELPRLAVTGPARLRQRLANRGPYGWSSRSGRWHGFESFALELQTELSPDAENRVLLSDERDAFGLRLAGVRWRWTETDKRSVRRTQALLAAALRASGIGELHVPDSDVAQNVTSPAGAYHHMGTTRMHADPKRGVVDGDCRVHGIDNLFVAGSSVFPTGGYANPTLTIVALALRLADHVAHQMQTKVNA